MSRSPVVVTAAVIVRSGRLLIARRGALDAHAGRWELPGGKVEPGESLAESLERELAEELGIRARVGEVLCSTRAPLGDGSLELHAMRVGAFSGRPVAREHGEIAWVVPEEWRGYPFLEPDLALLDCLAAKWDALVEEAEDGER